MGTTLDVEKNIATLPSGLSVPLHQKLSGHEPWELDWNAEPAAATVLVLAWKRMLRLGLQDPVLLFVLLELLFRLSRSVDSWLRPTRKAA